MITQGAKDPLTRGLTLRDRLRNSLGRDFKDPTTEEFLTMITLGRDLKCTLRVHPKAIQAPHKVLRIKGGETSALEVTPWALDLIIEAHHHHKDLRDIHHTITRN